MSYICNNCGKAQNDGSKPNKVVVETREAAKHIGREIVKEQNLCDICYSKWMFDHPVKVKDEMTKEEMEGALSQAFGVDAHLRRL